MLPRVRSWIILLAMGPVMAFAQDWKQLDVDELFALARKTAFADKHEEARVMLREVLERAPDYFDVRVFLARTYAWDGARAEARKELQTVLSKDPANLEAYAALTDVEMWDSQYEAALAVTTSGLHHAPNNEELLYKRADILLQLKRYEESSAAIARLLQIDPGHEKAAQLLKQVKTESLRYTAGLSYNLDLFSRDFNPANYLNAQLARNNRWGASIVRMNYTNRFGSNGLQGEIDLYPRIANGVYAYLNYGYSNSTLFPSHRVGTDIYTKLPASLEASAGFRYLNFGSAFDVTIYTASVGWYFRSYWFSLRPYLTPGGAGNSFSNQFNIRRYSADGQSWIGLAGGLGFSPDERRIQSASGLSINQINQLHAQWGQVSVQKTLPHHFLLLAYFGMTHQELSYDVSNYVWITSTTVTLRKSF